MSNEKFKVGQKWKTRGGDLATITNVLSDDYNYPVYATVGNKSDASDFDADGFHFSPGSESPLDLVEMVQDVGEVIGADVQRDGAVTDADPEPAQVSKIGNAVEAEERQLFIGHIISVGMSAGLSADNVREYIDLYDSALG